MLINLNDPIVNYKNISQKHLQYKGKHLNSCRSSDLAIHSISVIKKWGNDARYTTDSLEYQYLEAKRANPNTNIYSCLEQPSTDDNSFIDDNKECSEGTSFFNKLKATRIANINRLLIGHVNINLKCSQMDSLSKDMQSP